MTHEIGILIPKKNLAGLFKPSDMKALNELGNVRYNDQEAQLEEAAAAVFLNGCHIAVGSWGTAGPSEPILNACPTLQLWEHAAGSVKAFFGSHLSGKDLVIGSCAPAIADSVAEFVLGTLIVGLRRVLEHSRFQRADDTNGPSPAHQVRLFEARIGVVGASQVGRRVIQHLKEMGAAVVVFDPFLSEKEAREWGVEKATDLLEMCHALDALTLHTPLLPDTCKLVGKAHLEALPDSAVFVNCSRGGCVDQEALLDELRKDRLTAFLDVTEPEPLNKNHPLRSLSNCHITPHIAGGASQRIGQQVVSDIRAFLADKPLAMAVSADQLHRLA